MRPSLPQLSMYHRIVDYRQYINTQLQYYTIVRPQCQFIASTPSSTKSD